MMAAFADMVEILGARGIAVIPTDPDTPSVPLVKNPEWFGIRASRRLLANPRFAEANAGIWTGERSGLTIVDIDSNHPRHATYAIQAFGDTPLKVSTPSGGLHLYYRYGGERRRIRPFGKSLPLDVLGSGLAVVPPSRRRATETKAGGKYQILEGDLRDLARLPVLKPGSVPGLAHESAVDLCAKFSTLRKGDGRDNALFAYARSVAPKCDTLDELRSLVLAKNAEMAEPLSNAVASRKAAQAWRYKQEDRLMGAGSRVAILDQEVMSACRESPTAFYLLAYLKSEHPSSHVFAVVPEGIGAKLKMGHNTIRRGRDFLLEAGLLELVQVGGLTRDGKKPNLYRLKPSSQNGRE